MLRGRDVQPYKAARLQFWVVLRSRLLAGTMIQDWSSHSKRNSTGSHESGVVAREFRLRDSRCMHASVVLADASNIDSQCIELRRLVFAESQDYMVYWAKLSGKGADIGRLQRWLLEDAGRTARICNPFSETDHTLLLRSASAAAEAARLTTSAANINVDGTFAAAVRRALAAAPGAGGARQAAHVALALSTAAFDLRMYEQALQLLQRAAKEFAAAGGAAGDARLLHSQLEFSQAQALQALGRPSDAMRVLESVLKEAQVRPPVMVCAFSFIEPVRYAARDAHGELASVYIDDLNHHAPPTSVGPPSCLPSPLRRGPCLQLCRNAF